MGRVVRARVLPRAWGLVHVTARLVLFDRSDIISLPQLPCRIPRKFWNRLACILHSQQSFWH